MTDKIMPTNILVTGCGHQGYWEIIDGAIHPETKIEYTLVHHNPNYHVIKKSDVDGDVMDIVEWFIMEARLNNNSGDHDIMNPENYERCENEIVIKGDILRNALIAQYDPDILRDKIA